MSVEIELFTGESVDRSVIEFAHITLNAYNKKTGKNKLKQWLNVPVSSGASIEESTFENADVYLYYYADPMSDVSELRYEGKTLALQCELLEV